MAFPASFIDELLARNPIEDVVGQHVTLKRSGSTFLGCAPSTERRRPPSRYLPIRGYITASAAIRVAALSTL